MGKNRPYVCSHLRCFFPKLTRALKRLKSKISSPISIRPSTSICAPLGSGESCLNLEASVRKSHGAEHLRVDGEWKWRRLGSLLIKAALAVGKVDSGGGRDFVSSTFFQLNVLLFYAMDRQIEKDFAFDIYVDAFCYAAPSWLKPRGRQRRQWAWIHVRRIHVRRLKKGRICNGTAQRSCGWIWTRKNG